MIAIDLQRLLHPIPSPGRDNDAVAIIHRKSDQRPVDLIDGTDEGRRDAKACAEPNEVEEAQVPKANPVHDGS